MLNNVIDHSRGEKVEIFLERTATSIEILIRDNSEGIFKKIQRELGLIDERQALLELVKGKLTTAPDNHSGEGIFFHHDYLIAFGLCLAMFFLTINTNKKKIGLMKLGFLYREQQFLCDLITIQLGLPNKFLMSFLMKIITFRKQLFLFA